MTKPGIMGLQDALKGEFVMDLSKKGPMGLNALSASEAAARLASGAITSEALVRDCLARIEARDPEVGAWAYLDGAYAIEQARARDRESSRGLLHGVPIGIKDILDTVDMPTGHGSPIYAGDRPGRDSACVAAVRKGGMVILGKTVTTEFASPYPAGTRNPHDATRTPGVSSSGSAASVADYMVPLANGTQTGGSVIGPAASCGVYGYKASLDGLDRSGIHHLKPNIDTLGLFARSIADLALLRAVSHGKNRAESIELPAGTVPCIGVCRTPHWEKTAPCVMQALEDSASNLSRAGARVEDVTLPGYLAEIEPDFAIISGVEGARALATEARDHFETFNPWIRERCEQSAKITEERYREALGNAARGRALLKDCFTGFDVFITPSLPDEAPQDLTSVHPSLFNRMWTHMYTPAIHLPLFEGPNGMPVGFQVIGPQDQDDRTIAFAAWIGARLR
jgi:Asp-tRNA(Asn)/Glu-tRNA(Gln) amidotransferase A subunit family amidase